ncbi:DUF4288 domain-containing protein [Aneurinibacillus aneurinilyticus]|jgi:hypothetical protein|uniref:Uncharacterized protein n=1 Tax=Aneurinibacillus aneurinilyticus ATCC 12856 TaxID=649747 RepID=U1X4B6_ANEAE|nr:DUF4288 domain-containing protein [Aneurinibacillus aneurinilyticus]ERI09378.1 hypothetical protein HMPREF0083_02548 [Aneurinibacillus aneurinilyticus ATCC 12856]MCI1694741.1 DUF4288 domain-containing protein [Aneurinibacillus aneurinilyticus]MED0709147.1 DUF4288 domain-containing protein [Aneurinibacillus aneurinilyticus]MED0724830.1 DUF4288 domain-containing protein [Aneurinibacillus aneurinilyticus]MED0734598.1 DUF4288 domain-containing protein [Aneurinibacillus aneurinilyticus]
MKEIGFFGNAEKQAKRSEHEYLNAYGETVKWQLVSVLHAFELDDDEWENGTELYSRFIHAKREDDVKHIIARYYPEAVEE